MSTTPRDTKRGGKSEGGRRWLLSTHPTPPPSSEWESQLLGSPVGTMAVSNMLQICYSLFHKNVLYRVSRPVIVIHVIHWRLFAHSLKTENFCDPLPRYSVLTLAAIVLNKMMCAAYYPWRRKCQECERICCCISKAGLG